jgi:hypothetical protein
MSSKSEVGHAKNVANLAVLNTNIKEVGGLYNPSNPILLLSNLESLYANSYKAQELVNKSLAPYSTAVNEREILFKPFNKDLTKLRKAYKATQGVTTAEMEDFMTISRKLKGTRKTKVTAPTTSEEEKAQHSIAQLSYDKRTDNMDLLISLLQNTANYNPNEVEYQIKTYQDKKDNMLIKTKLVSTTFVPLNNARSARNATLYSDDDNLIDIANKAKDYLFSILDVKSVQYKAIARIKFKKR